MEIPPRKKKGGKRKVLTETKEMIKRIKQKGEENGKKRGGFEGPASPG